MQVSKKQEKTEPAEVIVAYKGFDASLKCRDQQYEIGQSYELDGGIEACTRGFHACEHPLNVFDHYAPAGSRFALVEQSGQISRHGSDTKVASSRIHVKAELTLAGLIKAAVDYTFSRALPVDPASPASSTGTQGAASSTGYRGAASSTGDRGAASSTGYLGAASSTGDWGAASATGHAGRVMGAEGNALFLTERDENYRIVAVWAGIAGRDGIKPNVWYSLKSGKPVEVTE